MAKFTLVAAHATRNPHQGLMVKAYYKQEPENPLEIPYSIIVFNRWPTVIVEAEIIEHKLDGVYEYPNGKRTDTIHAIAPLTEKGTYCMGMSPQEIITKRMNVLKKIEV